MYIEEYGFDRNDLIVVTAVKAYLKKLTPEARMEVLSEIVKKDGVIDGPALTAMIENAKAAWRNGSQEREIIRGHFLLFRSIFQLWMGKSM